MASASWSNGISIPLRRPLIACFVALGVGAMTAGCGGSEPSSAPTSLDSAAVARVANASPKPSTSSSTSASSPTDRFVVPEAAKAHTHDGAVAFVKFYWETLGRLDAQPRTGILELLAGKECKSCKMQIQTGASLKSGGYHVEVSNVGLRDFTIRPDSTRDQVIVVFHQTSDRGWKVGPNGSKEAVPAINQLVTARADWTGHRWVLGESGADEAR